MKDFFELNYPLWRMMGLLSDFMILTLVWVFFSLPVITLGPSTVALCHVGLQLVKKSGKGIVNEFVKTFFAKFKSTFFLGIGTLFIGISLLMYLNFLYLSTQKIAIFLFFVISFVILFLVFLFIYLYPLLSLLEMSKTDIIIIAYFMSIKYFKWTVFLFIIDSFLLFLTIYITPYIGFFTIGGIAYLNGKVIHMILEENSIPVIGK